jgi:PD-(D/E)XK nuclease superfamily
VSEDELIVVSYSEIDAARHCGLKHQLGYVERWRQSTVTGARGKGTDWHLVMEHHYRELQRLQAELREHQDGKLAAWVYPDSAAERIHQAVLGSGAFEGDNAELVAWMYQGHLKLYGLQPRWTVLAVEFNPEVPLPHPDGGPTRFALKIRADLVIQDTASGLVWLVDHKSGQVRPSGDFSLADQFGLYTWILRQLGRPVHGAIHSWAKTTRPQKPDPLTARFQQFPMDRSETELATIAADAYRTVERRYREVDAGEVPGVYPDMEWCKRRCDYRNAHIAARRGFTTAQDYLRSTGFEQNFERH